MIQRAKAELLSILVQTPGVFTFFPPGQERPLAHQRSQRKPDVIYAGSVPSPYFCNLRLPTNVGDKQGTLTVEAVALVGECLSELVHAEGHVRTIAGIPNAGDPLAAAVVAASGANGYPLDRIRFLKQDGPRGTEFVRAEGREGLAVDVVVDDVITLADTKVRFLKALGKKPDAICLLLDREEGGVLILQRMGYHVRAAFGLEDILAACLAASLITQEHVDRTRAYAKDRRELVNLYMEEILADLQGDL